MVSTSSGLMPRPCRSSAKAAPTPPSSSAPQPLCSWRHGSTPEVPTSHDARAASTQRLRVEPSAHAGAGRSSSVTWPGCPATLEALDLRADFLDEVDALRLAAGSHARFQGKRDHMCLHYCGLRKWRRLDPIQALPTTMKTVKQRMAEPSDTDISHSAARTADHVLELIPQHVDYFGKLVDGMVSALEHPADHERSAQWAPSGRQAATGARIERPIVRERVVPIRPRAGPVLRGPIAPRARPRSLRSPVPP